MRPTVFLLFMMFAAAAGVADAQVLAPTGTGDKSLEDRNVKNRSIDLERVDRDARKNDSIDQKAVEAANAARFEEIKQDFENLQRLQNDIITIYTKSRDLDYAKISRAAEQMTVCGTRLEVNLFPSVEDPKKKKKARETVQELQQPLPQDLKGLIIELDNTLAAFVRSPMFTNPQVVDVAANAKAHRDLKSVIRQTAALKLEADRAGKAN